MLMHLVFKLRCGTPERQLTVVAQGSTRYVDLRCVWTVLFFPGNVLFC